MLEDVKRARTDKAGERDDQPQFTGNPTRRRSNPANLVQPLDLQRRDAKGNQKRSRDRQPEHRQRQRQVQAGQRPDQIAQVGKGQFRFCCANLVQITASVVAPAKNAVKRNGT